MLGVEDVVHRGQPDVLVDPTVAGHEVGAEHLVVVRGRVVVVGRARVGVSHGRDLGRYRVSVVVGRSGNGEV